MSSFNPDSHRGEIDGKPASLKKQLEATQQEKHHFIITSGKEVIEVFLHPSGLFSDGNGIDGIEVKLESEKERLMRESFGNGQKVAGANNTKGMVLKAPMPGMVKTVSVAVGDKVQKTTQVLVLEAMKMENSISAGFVGIVKMVYAETGLSVEKNMPLVEFGKE